MLHMQLQTGGNQKCETSQVSGELLKETLQSILANLHIVLPEIKKKKKKKALVTSNITEMNSFRSLAWLFSCVKEKTIRSHFLNKILGQK